MGAICKTIIAFVSTKLEIGLFAQFFHIFFLTIAVFGATKVGFVTKVEDVRTR